MAALTPRCFLTHFSTYRRQHRREATRLHCIAMIKSSPALDTTSAVLPRFPTIRVARKGLIALGIKLFAAGLALALQVCLARTLGHAGYGEFAYVFAWLQLMLVFAHGGFATAALRYVAEYRARAQPALARGFIERSSQIVLLVSVILAVFMVGSATVLHGAGAVAATWHFFIAGISLPVLAQFALGSATVRALGHVIPSLLVGLVQPLLLLGALVIAFYLFRLHVSVSGVLSMNLLAAVSALTAVFTLQKYVGSELGQALSPEFRTSEWLSTSVHLLIVAGMFHLQGRTGVIASGVLLDEQMAGTYAAMERLSDVALLGLTSVNLLAAPNFAALHVQQRKLDLQRYARLAALGASGFMLASAIPLVLFSKHILSLYGDEFVAGYPVLWLLLGGVAANAMCGSAGLILNMTGHQRDTIAVSSISLCLNLLLSVLLIPRYGIIGTALANASAMALWSFALMMVVRWRLGVWSCIGYLN